MDKHEQLGPWIRRFLLEHLIKDRNLSPNTQRSYRDTLTMLLPFIAAQVHKPLDRLEVADLSAGHTRLFLAHLEQTRRVSAGTRNQRLAAIHSLARFIAECSPQHVAWYGEVRNVRFKKTIRGLIHYLDKPEVEALLAVPDCTTSVGHRNYVLLLFLYNSGARASEAANLCIADLDLDTGPHAESQRTHPRQRRENTAMPALGKNRAATRPTRARAPSDRTGVPEPTPRTTDAVWHLRGDQNVRCARRPL